MGYQYNVTEDSPYRAVLYILVGLVIGIAIGYLIGAWPSIFKQSPVGIVYVKCTVAAYYALQNRTVFACLVPDLDFPVSFPVEGYYDPRFIYLCKAEIRLRGGQRVLERIFGPCTRYKPLPVLTS